MKKHVTLFLCGILISIIGFFFFWTQLAVSSGVALTIAFAGAIIISLSFVLDKRQKIN